MTWNKLLRREPREYVGDLPVPLCTVGEFAFITGLSDQSIRRYIREGQIPATRIGRRLLIRTDKFLAGGEEGTNGEHYDFSCSRCGFCSDIAEPNYCPNCGAEVIE